VLGEFDRMEALLHSDDLFGIVEVTALGRGSGRNNAFAVGPVVDFARSNGVSHSSVTVVIHHRAYGTVDWKFLPVDAETGKLSIKV